MVGSGGAGGAGVGPRPEEGEEALLALTAAVESDTRHPLADAVLAAASSRGVRLPSVTQALTVPGAGVTADVEGRQVLVGREAWVAGQLPASCAAAAARLRAAADEGSGGERQTKVFVAADGKLLGMLAFRDALRADAAATVAGLRAQGGCGGGADQRGRDGRPGGQGGGPGGGTRESRCRRRCGGWWCAAGMVDGGRRDGTRPPRRRMP